MVHKVALAFTVELLPYILLIRIYLHEHLRYQPCEIGQAGSFEPLVSSELESVTTKSCISTVSSSLLYSKVLCPNIMTFNLRNILPQLIKYAISPGRPFNHGRRAGTPALRSPA